MFTCDYLFLLGEASEWTHRLYSTINSRFIIDSLKYQEADIQRLLLFPKLCIVISPIEEYGQNKSSINLIQSNPNLYLVLSTPVNPSPKLARDLLKNGVAKDYISRSTQNSRMIFEINEISRIMDLRISKQKNNYYNKNEILNPQKKIELLKNFLASIAH